MREVVRKIYEEETGRDWWMLAMSNCEYVRVPTDEYLEWLERDVYEARQYNSERQRTEVIG